MLKGASVLKDLMFDKRLNVKDRLVVTPILNWESQVKEGSGSIDLRLGCHFIIPKRTQLASLDPLHKNYERDKREYKDEAYIGIGDHFVLHPRQFILGHTLEYIHIPSNLSAYVICRSSWGRDGLVIATATGVHPGFSGVLTLELTNLGEIPLYLYPGIAIAQLFVHEVHQSDKARTDTSSFLGATKPESGKPISDEDKRIIKAFKKSKD